MVWLGKGQGKVREIHIGLFVATLLRYANVVANMIFGLILNITEIECENPLRVMIVFIP